MAGRSGDTFKKRQKEVARAEKHREKLARRLERKQHKGEPGDGLSDADADGLSDNDLSSANDLSEDAAQSEESGASQLG
jgi:hypothetical protein